MKLSSALLLFSSVALSAAEKANPAAAVESVAPTELVGRGSKPQRLISSELNGRELQFITAALDVRSTLVYLAGQAAEGQNPNLRKLGDELQQNLPRQTAVLSTLAEMRSVTVAEPTARQQALEKKLAALKGARFEKTLMDALLDANQDLVNTCEAGLRSTDKSVQQFAEQTLPYARGTLARVQAMAGIAPKRAAEAPVPPPVGAGPQRTSKPGFRANIPSAEPVE